MEHRRWLPYAVLAAGVLVASSAAIVIRVAQEQGVPSLTIAAGRLTIAALILTPLTLIRARPELRQIRRSDWLWGVGAGVCLAIHFAAWIGSLDYTSVASSTALVSTNPIFVALASWLIFRERLGWGVWLGVLLTILGSALIGLSDRSAGGSDPLLGDALAIAGAITVSGYLLVGRNLRARLSILPYIWLVYSTAAVVLLIWMTLAGQSLLGLDPWSYAPLLWLALGPQLLGHTSFNWAVKYLSATMVTVSILGEPIASALLAVVFLQQRLQPLQLAGAAVLLAGIATVTLAERRAQPKLAAPLVENEGVIAP